MATGETKSTPPSPEVKILTKAFDPVKLLRIVSEDDYEELIQEWANSFLAQKSDKNYIRVELLGGAGDKGRDVVCTIDDKKDIWDNYQCKHYENKLTPSDIYVEIGKLCYFCFKGDYSVPRKYYFVSPCGVGTKLRDFLKRPAELKAELIKNWKTHCEAQITKKEIVNLSGKIEAYVEANDAYQAKRPLCRKFRSTLPQQLRSHQANGLANVGDSLESFCPNPIELDQDSIFALQTVAEGDHPEAPYVGRTNHGHCIPSKESIFRLTTKGAGMGSKHALELHE
jgi:hypothetical protein